MDAALLPLPQTTGRPPSPPAGAGGGDFAAALRQMVQMPEEGTASPAAGDPQPGGDAAVPGAAPDGAAAMASAWPASLPMAGRAIASWPTTEVPPEAAILTGPAAAAETNGPPLPGESLPRSREADPLAEAMEEAPPGTVTPPPASAQWLPPASPSPPAATGEVPAAAGQGSAARVTPGPVGGGADSTPPTAPTGALAAEPAPEGTGFEPPEQTAATPGRGTPRLAPGAGPAGITIPTPGPAPAGPQPAAATPAALRSAAKAEAPAVGSPTGEAATAEAVTAPRLASGRSAAHPAESSLEGQAKPVAPDTPSAPVPGDTPPHPPPQAIERPLVAAVPQRAAPDPAGIATADRTVDPIPGATAGPASLAPAPLPGPAPAEAPTVPRSLPPARQAAPVAIALALAPGGQAARLIVALEPDQLGRVEVRIERDAAGDVAAVRVLAERPETLALLQRDAREFDRSLAQAGVQVPEGGMSFGLAADAGGGQGQGAEPGGQRPGGRGAPGAGPLLPEAPEPRPGRSLLDIAV